MQDGERKREIRIVMVAVAAGGLAVIYFFQRMDYLNILLGIFGMNATSNANLIFVFNKTLRLILNDALCIVLIYALFGERKYMRIAFWLFCLELFVILPAYLLVKIHLEGPSEISSPLLSQIHRLIVNPMLMLLLIVSFYYQRSRNRE